MYNIVKEIMAVVFIYVIKLKKMQSKAIIQCFSENKRGISNKTTTKRAHAIYQNFVEHIILFAKICSRCWNESGGV